MTITLITGKTGNGKSLYAITEIEKQRLAQNREVYYNGIPDLKLPWIPFDDTKDWYNLPHGAMIVFDEAQDTFRPRSNASAVPEHVQRFEKHRKQGHDVFLITQQPTLIDSNIRALTDVHFHLMRKFGAEKAIVHKWFTCKSDCKDNRAGSITSEWSYPKDNYALYKSADVHTIKADVPFRYYLKFIIPAIGIALAAYAYYVYHHLPTKKAEVSADGSVKPSIGLKSQVAPGRKEDDPNYWFQQNTPRVPDLALSAPKYDEVTKPTTAPYPAACVMSKKTGCHCWTQQATKMTVSEGFCKQVAQNGYFIDWQEQHQNQDNQQGAQAQINQRPPDLNNFQSIPQDKQQTHVLDRLPASVMDKAPVLVPVSS